MRFDPITPNSTAQTAGDRAFYGVANHVEPDALEGGLVAHAENVDFERQTARTRAGSVLPIDHQGAALAGGNILGHGIYSPPRTTDHPGRESLLLATAAGVWLTSFGRTPILLGMPEPLTGSCALVQAFGVVQLFRGEDKDPWQWDGNPLRPFSPIEAPAASELTRIPNGPTSIKLREGLLPVLIQNRLAVPHGASACAFSDLLDYGAYDPAFSDFNLTGGSDDQLAALCRFNSGTLLVFNDQSVQRLSGIEPTLTALQLDPVDESRGCRAGATVARMGDEVFWLSDTGVFTLSEVEQRNRVATVSLSDAIPEIVARIHWSAAGTACACVWGKRYFLAVPLDGAEGNNALLPYNAATGQWEGIHWLPDGIFADALVLLDWHGRKCLHAVDYTTGEVRRMYFSEHDYLAAMDLEERQHIPLTVRTRGYAPADGGESKALRGRIFVKTWNPTLAFAALTDGVAVREGLQSFTRDRQKNTVLSPDLDIFNLENPDDDHGRAYREDYSHPIATPLDYHDGVNLRLQQSTAVKFTVNLEGRYHQLEITNTTGTAELTRVTLDTTAARTDDLIHA